MPMLTSARTCLKKMSVCGCVFVHGFEARLSSESKSAQICSLMGKKRDVLAIKFCRHTKNVKVLYVLFQELFISYITIRKFTVCDSNMDGCWF